MPKKTTNGGERARWERIDTFLRAELPDFMSWEGNTTDFGELRLKSRTDGTMLAIAKGYGPDGGPVVCFGVGYGVVLSLMALNSSIKGGNWRTDKPWQPSTK